MRTLKINIITLFILLGCAYASAQGEISVKSFRLLERDLAANLEGTKRMDPNTRTPAALIKVVTSETGFFFDGGLLGLIGDNIQKVGEIWVYVPPKAKQITIQHQKLGVLRNYYYPIPIESGRTYEMVLTTGKILNHVEEDYGGNYLVMTVSPANAEVKINDEIVEVAPNGEVQKNWLPYGEYLYQITAPLFETEMGRFKITSDDRTVVNEQLKPAYGLLRISSDPAGATVYIDDEVNPIGETPFTTKRLAKGKHTLKLQKSSYKTKTVTVDVLGDGNTQDFTSTLEPNFAVVTLTVDNNADIYIDDEKKGTSTWSGNLPAGSHLVEARKVSHYSAKTVVDVVAGVPMTQKLKSPTPRYGKLSISTIPMGATVKLNGKVLGDTPHNFSNILIGKHQLTISKEGYATIEEEITIEEGKITKKDYTLENGGTVIIESSQTLSKVYIDGVYKGVAPYTLSGKSGDYSVRVTAEGYHDATGPVTITAGKTTTKRFSPQSLTGGVAIYSNASGATIRIDGVYKGSAPYSFTSTPGEYEVEVSASGYKTKKQKIHVIAGNVNSVTVTLDPKRTTPSCIKNLSYMDPGDWFSVGGGWDILWSDNISMGGFVSFKIGQEQLTWLTAVINIGGYKMGKTESGMFFMEEGDPEIETKNEENSRTTYTQIPLSLALRLRLAGGEWVDSKTVFYAGPHISYNFNAGDNVKNGMVNKSNYSLGGHVGFNVARVFEMNLNFTYDLKPAYDQEYIYITNPAFYAEKESRINKRWRIGTSLVFYVPFTWTY